VACSSSHPLTIFFLMSTEFGRRSKRSESVVIYLFIYNRSFILNLFYLGYMCRASSSKISARSVSCMASIGIYVYSFAVENLNMASAETPSLLFGLYATRCSSLLSTEPNHLSRMLSDPYQELDNSGVW
jgi:hypothetical protein